MGTEYTGIAPMENCEPLSQGELEDAWLKLSADGYRQFTQDEIEKILGKELAQRLYATAELMRKNHPPTGGIN